MSIYIYGRINKKCINTDLLEKNIVDYFSLSNNVFKKRDKDVVTYEGISGDNKLIISFEGEKKPPYNVYDSDIIDGEYEYMQLIILLYIIYHHQNICWLKEFQRIQVFV